MKRKEVFLVYDKAKIISGSKRWEVLLSTMDKRVRFEDGYVAGWFDHKKHLANLKRSKKSPQ